MSRPEAKRQGKNLQLKEGVDFIRKEKNRMDERKTARVYP